MGTVGSRQDAFPFLLVLAELLQACDEDRFVGCTVGLLEPFAERFKVSPAPLQGLIDDMELSINELSREWELDSYGRRGWLSGSACHISRRVKGIVHALGTMLKQIRGDDGGDHGNDNDSGDVEEHTKVQRGEFQDCIETGREEYETLANKLDHRTMS